MADLRLHPTGGAEEGDLPRDHVQGRVLEDEEAVITGDLGRGPGLALGLAPVHALAGGTRVPGLVLALAPAPSRALAPVARAGLVPAIRRLVSRAKARAATWTPTRTSLAAATSAMGGTPPGLAHEKGSLAHGLVAGRANAAALRWRASSVSDAPHSQGITRRVSSNKHNLNNQIFHVMTARVNYL